MKTRYSNTAKQHQDLKTKKNKSILNLRLLSCSLSMLCQSVTCSPTSVISLTVIWVSHYFSGALPPDRIYEREGRRRQVRMDLPAAVAALSAAGLVHAQKRADSNSTQAHTHLVCHLSELENDGSYQIESRQHIKTVVSLHHLLLSQFLVCLSVCLFLQLSRVSGFNLLYHSFHHTYSRVEKMCTSKWGAGETVDWQHLK